MRQWDPLENTVNFVERLTISLYEVWRELGLYLKILPSMKPLLQIQGTFDCCTSLTLPL
jgi:hypothetical protein